MKLKAQSPNPYCPPGAGDPITGQTFSIEKRNPAGKIKNNQSLSCKRGALQLS